MFPKFVWFGRNFNLTPFYYPDDIDAMSDALPGEDQDDKTSEEDTTDDVSDEKDEDKDETDTDETSKDTNDKEEETDKEDEQEEEKEPDEDLQLTSTVTDIKKEFPNFFKKFPDVKSALFREQRYLETVGPVEQAEVVAGRADTLSKIETDLSSGEVGHLLDTLKGSDEEAYSKVVTNFLPYLQSKDKDLYLEVSAVPIKQLCRAAWREGKGRETDLGKAAAYIHNYFFGNMNFDDKVKFEKGSGSNEPSTKEKELSERLNQIEMKEYTNFKGSVDDSYVSRMRAVVKEGLDKDDRLSDYAKSKLSDDILIDIRDQMLGDKRYTKQMSALWDQARRAGFSNDFKSRLISTSLARAKSLVPESRKKLVAKALGKKVSTNKDTVETTRREDTSRRRTSTEGRQRTTPNSKPLTDMDILRAP